MDGKSYGGCSKTECAKGAEPVDPPERVDVRELRKEKLKDTKQDDEMLQCQGPIWMIDLVNCLEAASCSNVDGDVIA